MVDAQASMDVIMYRMVHPFIHRHGQRISLFILHVCKKYAYETLMKTI